jgi:hypothetical protein
MSRAISYIFINSLPAELLLFFYNRVLAFILLTNGILQLTIFKDQIAESGKLGLLLISIAMILYLILRQIWSYQKKSQCGSSASITTIRTFNFETNNLLGPQQNILDPLSQTYLTRKMQITSSSPELLICWNGGMLSIAKGNPFSGGIGAIEDVLRAKGVQKR